MQRWISMLAVAGVALGCSQPADPPTAKSVTIPVEEPETERVTIADLSDPDHDFEEIPLAEAMSRVPQAVFDVIDTINREDWEALSKFDKPEMRAARFLIYRRQGAVRVAVLQHVSYGIEHEGKLCTEYSFSMQQINGDLYPHQFELLVHEKDKQAEVLDFWEYGW